MLTKRDLLRSAALAAMSVTTTKAVPASAQAKAEWPGIIEAKAIAEEGFIYGLPIVMNYAVMYEYSVDKNSGQYKAPFNHIKNEARVFTPKDTSIVTPNSDTPYSFLWMDLRAEPMVLSVPAVLTLVEAMGDTDADYRRARPYFQTLGVIAAGGKVDGDRVQSRVAVGFK